MNTSQIERHFHPRSNYGGHIRINGYTKFLKKIKKRIERRKAKHDPECQPTYKKYVGWEY